MQTFWAEHGDAVIVGVTVACAAAVLVVLREALTGAAKAVWGWLKATARGQGARFRGRYLKAMADRHGRLPLIGIYNRGDLYPPRLREAFVSLRLATGQEDGPRLDWHQVFRSDQRRIVVLGAPGAGKTTLLDYLVLVFSGAADHRLGEELGKPLPLFARLRELGTEGKPDLLSLLRASAPFTEVPERYPRRFLERGGCAVLLDGLDEVLDRERHARAVDGIRRLVEDFPRNFYFVTCRLAGWHNQLANLDFLTYEVQPFDGDDIRRFVTIWYREVLRAKEINQLVSLLAAKPNREQVHAAEERTRVDAARRSEELLAALGKNENLLRIARTPLLLSLVTLVHYHRVADLPQGRAELYKDCLRILLELWDKERSVAVAGPTLNEKLLVLRAIAFHFLVNNVLEAEMPELEQVIAPLLAQIKEPVAAETLVSQVVERSGVLVELALGRYGFAHRALHDALAADWIVEHERDDLLLSHAGEERWREVILIAAGRAPAARAGALVEALLQSDAEGYEEGAALQVAGLALAEDIQIGEDLRGKVRQQLIERLSREEAAGAFGRLAGALLAGDPEAARDWMKETLGGERDPQRRKRLLDLLPALGEEHGRAILPLLGRMIGDANADSGTRKEAALALARMGIAPEVGLWEVLAEARTHGAERLKAAATWAWCELGRFSDLGLVQVPAGEFLMGSREEDEQGGSEQPQHTLYLPTFYLGKFPVTTGEYRFFLAASGREVGDAAAFEKANRAADHPVVRFSWHDALAFAHRYGMGLPSEAEWEKGARGTDGRIYPWGNEWQTERANTIEARTLLDRLRRRRWGGTTPVGQFSPLGDSPYGCADMGGNVWEWTRSEWGSYPYVADDGRENFESPSRCVLRGGAFSSVRRDVRCAVRHWNVPDLRLVDVGFRVVVSPFRPEL